MPKSSAKMTTKLGLSAADAASFAAQAEKASRRKQEQAIHRVALRVRIGLGKRLRASWRLALIRATRDPAPAP